MLHGFEARSIPDLEIPSLVIAPPLSVSRDHVFVCPVYSKLLHRVLDCRWKLEDAHPDCVLSPECPPEIIKS